MSVSSQSIEQLAINTIRTLSMDAVQAANSGHPGTPMALAPVTYSLWSDTLKYDPALPNWPARDRFILSCGHASMLLYSTLHLAGVKALSKDGTVEDRPSITLDDIKKFRQLDSPCAGHPEYSFAAGIETTTGPLGQGVGNSVGMAIAAKWMSATYDKPGYDLFGFNVYALCSDGDIMEGVCAEAASLAGHLKLGNLCWVYDDNGITIEGETDLAFSENVPKRFEGLGWRVLRVDDANDLEAIHDAFESFLETQDKPTLIVLKSVIGWGSPNKANTHGAHGAPLGDDEIKLTKKAYGWPEDQKFLVPDGVREHFDRTIGARGREASETWHAKFDDYAKKFPTEAKQLQSIWKRELPQGWDSAVPNFPADEKGLASRVSSGKVLNALAKNIPWLIGGSADLAGSTMTLLEGEKSFSSHDYSGRNFHFGIREHGMAAACNGMSLCGIRAYGATFFVFTDYMRPSMRLASIMHQPTLFVLTHDSIGLGEDGPTHQPIEHLAAMRAIPGMFVMRPGDANETAECYKAAMRMGNHPVSMVLSRQNLPTLDRTKYGAAAGTAKGGYILADCEGTPEVILMATGSEVAIALEGYKLLIEKGVKARMVSMPCMELFKKQDEAYRHSVLPPDVQARVAVEAGLMQGWEQVLGERGRFVGMETFGASGPFKALYEQFKITPANVAAQAQESIKNGKQAK
ncbi:MAG TPA: transketolase [Pirellulaceae bacterium]|jgi:transketolase|nr:transketolase [Pirellulaceae bacterium]